MESFWQQINESELRQGDYLPNCLVPVSLFPSDATLQQTEQPLLDVEIQERDLIIITQSCDLENRKARLVALCPIYAIADFEQFNLDFTKKGKWNEVRRGRIEGLHLLASPTNPANSRDALVVDFREIHSLPFDFLLHHATQMGDRWRLKSPFLEHFSQNFARFFMRVGLPSSVPEFK
jgi:hypothetical protein